MTDGIVRYTVSFFFQITTITKFSFFATTPSFPNASFVAWFPRWPWMVKQVIKCVDHPIIFLCRIVNFIRNNYTMAFPPLTFSLFFDSWLSTYFLFCALPLSDLLTVLIALRPICPCRVVFPEYIIVWGRIVCYGRIFKFVRFIGIMILKKKREKKISILLHYLSNYSILDYFL